MDITDFEYLYNSMNKCKNNVLWKESVAHYYLHGIEETLKLEKQLKNKTYKPKPPYKFVITSPKEREILSIVFRDRVYQRSLNDNVLYPAIVKSFIYDNAACQIGKGTDFARNRLKCFLNRYYRKYGSEGYVLQIDIHGYYPNMLHKEVEKIFKEKLSDEHYIMSKDILDNQYFGEKGYNPGSQMVQIAGISYLNNFDHYCKEQLKIKYYVRYMDDIIIIHNDKAFLEECLKNIQIELAKIGCEFNVNKTKIYKLSNGINFLGYKFSLTKTGKVLMIIRKNKVHSQKRKIKRLVRLSKLGILPKKNVDDSFNCFLSNLDKGNNFRIKKCFRVYYSNLWRNYEINAKTKRLEATSKFRKFDCSN